MWLLKSAVYAFKSRIHICSKMKPNVFNCVSNASMLTPIAATAMEGSIKQRFGALRNAVLLLMAGHQASMSWMTNNFSNAAIYPPPSVNIP